MSGEPCILAEVTFLSLAECGRWYPPRPPWGGVHACLMLACIEGATSPTLVRFVEGPRVAAGEPGRFVLAPQAPLGDASAFQPGVRFYLIDVKFNGRVGNGVVLERLGQAAPLIDEPDREGEAPPGELYGPPARLRIPRNEDRFVNVGRVADGTQFLAYVVGAFPAGWRSESGDWTTKKRWQAVVHRFDAEGRHAHTEVRLGGVEADDNAVGKAFTHLNAIHDDLAEGGEPEYGDIWVGLFSVEMDGILHGLVYECHESEDGGYDETVTLHPADIVFGPPWDSGSYST